MIVEEGCEGKGRGREDGDEGEGRKDGREGHGICTDTAVLIIISLALVLGITALAMPWLKNFWRRQCIYGVHLLHSCHAAGNFEMKIK